jgi:hypothetical protein
VEINFCWTWQHKPSMVLQNYNLPDDQQTLGAWCGLDVR